MSVTTPILTLQPTWLDPIIREVFWIGFAAALIAGGAGLYFSAAFPLIFHREIPIEYTLLFYAFALVLLLLSNPVWVISLQMSLWVFSIGFTLAIAVTIVASLWLHRLFASEYVDRL